MTDMPIFGVLCCGNDIKSLSDSVRACGFITDILKSGGFASGGYHTALVKKGDASLCGLCEEKLFHLSRNCDAVFTVGCEGFSEDDILPDITAKLCESDAAFFTSRLCGLSGSSGFDAEYPKRKRAELAPSRARAGILEKCLILNIRSNTEFIGGVLPCLLPSLSFAVSCISGRNAEECRILNRELARTCDSSLKNRTKFSNVVRNSDTKSR